MDCPICKEARLTSGFATVDRGAGQGPYSIGGLGALSGFSQENRERCESPTGFNHYLSDWSLSDWMTALCGEVGEAANVVKKLNRVRDGVPGNDKTPDELRAQLADEIADIFIYLDLFAQAAAFDLATVVRAKFDKTSTKIGYSR